MCSHYSGTSFISSLNFSWASGGHLVESNVPYLRERCTIDSDSGAVHIEGPDGKTQLAEDTWRTAGTSQKVASGFGSDVRKCITNKLTTERQV